MITFGRLAGAVAGSAAVAAVAVVQLGTSTPAQAAVRSVATPTPATSSSTASAAAVRATLHTGRHQVDRGELFVLTGTGRAGGTVTVQQRVGSGAWQQFAATSVVRRDGHFQLRLESGRVGRNQFRVRIAGSVSNAVTVQVGPAVPVLGRARTAPPVTRGFGHAHPALIDNGGDPSGIAERISWQHWGSAVATGHGQTSIFRPQGGYYSHPGAVQFRASGLRTCADDGSRVYTRLIAREVTKPGGSHWTRWFTWSTWKNACAAS